MEALVGGGGSSGIGVDGLIKRESWWSKGGSDLVNRWIKQQREYEYYYCAHAPPLLCTTTCLKTTY